MKNENLGADEIYLAPETTPEEKAEPVAASSEENEISHAPELEPEDPAKSVRVSEIIELREENRKVFRMSDGSEQAVFFPEAVHVLNEETQTFDDVDNTITLEEDKRHYKSGKNHFKARFSCEEDNDELFSIESGMHRVTVSTKKNTKQKNKGVKPEVRKKEAEGFERTDLLAFKDVHGGADYEYSVNGNGVKENIVVKEKRDECTVTVVTPYEKRLQDLAGFSNEATALILKLYNKVDNLFISENALQKAWRCARLLSEFSYNSFSFNDVAGSLTNQDNRQSYFMTTLGYTENEYTALSVALSNNHTDGNTIDFTHLQYSLAARLAYTLDKDGLASNLGSQFKTGNWGIYSDEDISYLGGWLGDATLRNDGGTGVPIMKNDDYMSDLDAENVYRLLLQGYTSIDAMNVYYSNMNASNTRADMFLQYIPYSTVKQKIFYELIDAQLYIFLSNASSQGDIYMTNYWLNLINDEEYHFNEIKSKYSDTYDFLMSLNDRLPTIKHYS